MVPPVPRRAYSGDARGCSSAPTGAFAPLLLQRPGALQTPKPTSRGSSPNISLLLPTVYSLAGPVCLFHLAHSVTHHPKYVTHRTPAVQHQNPLISNRTTCAGFSQQWPPTPRGDLRLSSRALLPTPLNCAVLYLMWTELYGTSFLASSTHTDPPKM